MDTLLPNHWCASSCATSRSEPRAPSTWLAPNSESPCASTGTSSSSSVTTTAYSSNGYGPNNSWNTSIICGWRAKSREKSPSRRAGMCPCCGTPPGPGSPSSTVWYLPIASPTR